MPIFAFATKRTPNLRWFKSKLRQENFRARNKINHRGYYSFNLFNITLNIRTHKFILRLCLLLIFTQLCGRHVYIIAKTNITMFRCSFWTDTVEKKVYIKSDKRKWQIAEKSRPRKVQSRIRCTWFESNCVAARFSIFLIIIFPMPMCASVRSQ